jgi:hypothetical protein
MATIEISTDFDGQFQWKSDKLDGRQTLWLMVDTLIDMYRYFFTDKLRPVFSPQAARVCIELDNEKLSIAFRPEDDLAAAKALVAASLVALSEKSGDESTDPFEVMFGALVIQTEETVGGITLA